MEGKFQCENEGCTYNVDDKAQMSAHAKYHHKSKEENSVFSNDHMDMLSLAPSETGLYVNLFIKLWWCGGRVIPFFHVHILFSVNKNSCKCHGMQSFYFKMVQ